MADEARRSNRPKMRTFAASQYDESRKTIELQRQAAARRKFINAQKQTQVDNTPTATMPNESEDENVAAPIKRVRPRKNTVASSPPPADLGQTTTMNQDETWVGVRMEEIKRDYMIDFLSHRENRDDLGSWDNQELELLLGDDPDWKEPNYSELLKLKDGQAQSSAGASEEPAPELARSRYKFVQPLGTTCTPDTHHAAGPTTATQKRPRAGTDPIDPNKRQRPGPHQHSAQSQRADSIGRASQQPGSNTNPPSYVNSNSQPASQVVPRPPPAPHPSTRQPALGQKTAPLLKQAGPLLHPRAPSQLRVAPSSQGTQSAQLVTAPSAPNQSCAPTSSQVPPPGSGTQKHVSTTNNAPPRANVSQLPPGRPLDVAGRPKSNNPAPRPSPQPELMRTHPSQPPVRTGPAAQGHAQGKVPPPLRDYPPHPPAAPLVARQPAPGSNPPGQANARNTPAAGAPAPGPQPKPPTVHRRFLSAFISSRDSSSRSPSPSVFAPSDTDSATNSVVGRAVKRKRKAKPRPKAADYDGTEKDILERAAHAYEARMVGYGMYESDSSILLTRMLDAWEDSCEHYAVKSSEYPMTLAHQKCLKARLTSYCGRMKDRIIHDIPKLYKLTELGQEDLRMTAGDLCPNGLHKKPDSPPGTGQFQHPAIQTAANVFLFHKKDDLGIEFNQIFNPMTLEAIAFFCTIIQAVLEGIREGKVEKLNTDKQRVVYTVHLTNARKFANLAADRCQLVQAQLHDRAFAQSGAVLPPVAITNPNDLLADDDIVPDPPSEHELNEWADELGKISMQMGIHEGSDALGAGGGGALDDMQASYDPNEGNGGEWFGDGEYDGGDGAGSGGGDGGWYGEPLEDDGEHDGRQGQSDQAGASGHSGAYTLDEGHGGFDGTEGGLGGDEYEEGQYAHADEHQEPGGDHDAYEDGHGWHS